MSRNISNGERKRPKNKKEREDEKLNLELLVAIQKSDKEEVERLLRNGANPEACCQATMCSSVNLATLKNDKDILEILLRSGASDESRDTEGRQAVHIACFQGNIEILDLLLSRKPNLINSRVEPPGNVWKLGQKDSWYHNHDEITSLLPDITTGSTPLHVACRWSRSEIVTSLLQKKADVNMTDEQELTPLNVVGLENNEKQKVLGIVKDLFELGAKVVEKTETDGTYKNPKHTALHNAVEKEDIETIRFLLENNKFAVTVLNENGDSPLHLAVRKKLLEPVKEIISWLTIDELEIQSSNGLTLLHQAVLEQWENGVGILLEAGADIKKLNPSKETVLHVAAQMENTKILKELLIMESAYEIIDSRDKYGFTPLFHAINNKFLRNVEVLIEYDANLSLKLPGGMNIYHYAVQNDTNDILKLTLSIDIKDNLLNEYTKFNGDMSGMTPLHVAAYNGNEEAVKLLIYAGAKINLMTTSETEGTALHLTAQKGYSRTVKVILSSYTDAEKKYNDLSLKDGFGWTPLQIAALNGHGKCTIMMLENGANITDRVNYQGGKKSALDIMVSNLPKCADLLDKLFDSSIKCEYKKRNSAKFSIDLDYNILCHKDKNHPDRQLLFLDMVLNHTILKEKLILHPLVESFIYYKWKKMKMFFLILFGFYVYHTLCMTVYSYSKFVWNNDQFSPLLMSLNLFLIIITEIFQVFPFKWNYFRDVETWIKWTLILSSIGTLYLDPLNEMKRHFACCCVLLAWTEMLFLSARFSVFGLHVLMFEKVVENIFQVLTRFCFLFVGFLFAFMIHFKGKEPFSDIFSGICKIFIMIVELDYSNDFNNSDDRIGRIMYVVFFLLIATAMTNLIIGMAVSDVALLENQGRIQRLVKQTAFLNFLELCLNKDSLMKCFSRNYKKLIINCRTVQLTMSVHPNNHNETLPEDLRSSLLAKVHTMQELLGNY